MLDKVKNTVLALVSTAFVLAGVWNWYIPISQDVLVQLLTLVFTIIGGIGGGVSFMVRKYREAVK